MSEYRFDEVVEWNHHVGKLLNATNTKLKKLLPSMDFVKVSEWQQRGALHLHAILRIPRREWHLVSVEQENQGTTLVSRIREQASTVVVDDRWAWGDKALDLREIKTGDDREKAARYLAKALAYVTKDVAEDQKGIRRGDARKHFDRLDCAARDMKCDGCEGGPFACGRLCHRRWGARSSTMSKSRGEKDRIGWCSLRRLDLIRSRREYAQRMAALNEAEGLLEEFLDDQRNMLFGKELLSRPTRT